MKDTKKIFCHFSFYDQIKIQEKLEEMGEQKIHREGYRSGSWVLLDFGCVVVHLFMEEARQFYSLERLWADAKECDITPLLGPEA